MADKEKINITAVPDSKTKAEEKKTKAKSKPAKSSAVKEAGKKTADKPKKESTSVKSKKDNKSKKTTAKKTTEKKDTSKQEEKPKKTKVSKGQKEKEYLPRLMAKYRNEIVTAMMKQLNYSNVNQVPKLIKITINVGMGLALQNNKLLDSAIEDLQIISGQKPVTTSAKRSVSNFKLRQGNKIGCKVTLREERMYEFLDRLISIAIPRIRDFRGLSNKSFDGFGNYSLGVKEQIIFPEINYDNVESIHGMDISIVTTANGDEEAHYLLKQLGMPFADQAEAAAIA